MIASRSYPRKFGIALAKLMSENGRLALTLSWGSGVANPARTLELLSCQLQPGEESWDDARLEDVVEYLSKSKYLQIAPAVAAPAWQRRLWQHRL